MILQEKVNERDVPAVLDDLQSRSGKGAGRRSARAMLGMRWSDSGRPGGRALAHGGAVLCRRNCAFADGRDSIDAGARIPGGTEKAEPAHTAASSCASAVAAHASNALAAYHHCTA